MLNIPSALAKELSLPKWQIDHALKLLNEGGTVPFVARYRKEQTGGMDEIQLRSLLERHQYLTELEDRKKAILQSIGEQGKLNSELRARIEAAVQKGELEDLYLPYPEDMVLEGVVTNVTNFGAFVDVGVKRDGLVHISQLADRFVKDPTNVVKVGQVVTVRVTSIDEKLNRIGLSMRLQEKN